MKSITIIGNIGANAIVRTASDGRQLMSFSVAVSRKDKPTTWFGVVSPLRENLIGYLVKGQCVCVIGDLDAKVYKDTPDLTVNADRIELCGSAPDKQDEQQ